MKTSDTPRKPNRFKVSTSITIHPVLLARAHDMMKAEGHATITSLIEEMIRREWERRHQPGLQPAAPLPDDAVSSAPAQDPVAAHADQILDTVRQRARRTTGR